MSFDKPQVLNVGQCSMDHGNISRLLQDHFDADVRPATTSEEAMKLLDRGGIDLVLVNRILDSNGQSGLELIKQLMAGESTRSVPVMLVSNFEDAQLSARQVGARPGFGKASLHHPRTLELLAQALSREDSMTKSQKHNDR